MARDTTMTSVRSEIVLEHHQHLGATRQRNIGGTERRCCVVAQKEIIEEQWPPVGRHSLGCCRLRKEPIRLCAQLARPSVRAAPIDLPV